MSTEEARWSTSQLEALIQQAVMELSQTVHELEHFGTPSLSDSAITLNRLHQYVEEFRLRVVEDCTKYGLDAEEATQSLQGLMKAARLVEDHQQKLQAIAAVLDDLQQLSSRSETDWEVVHWIKKSSLDLLQEMSSLAGDTMDGYLQRTSPFVALHRWLSAEDLSDEDWDYLSNIVASGLSKSLSIAVQRGRLYIAARVVRAESETDGSLEQNRTTSPYEVF